ncbi:MAG: ATP-dependent nuclease subunit B [Clostridia bacterium]|nr:ATP-dependent nuclease subunit B [Clostridia bacterium]
MLKLMIGRAGSGKSTAILQAIAQSGGVRPQLLIVPEQASHETERRLCAVAGNQASLYAEVLSFTRLGSRVLAQAGGLAAPVLDAGGRLLLMYAALKSVAGHLTVYARPSRKPAFLSGLLATLDECKQYAVRPEDLARTGEELEGQEGDKLKDLGLIFGAYEAMTARTAADPRDRLTRLAEGLHRCRYAQGMDVYVDAFTDFTPQEGMVLKELLGQARSVTVALTGDETDREAAVFAPSRRTAAYLLRLAREAGVTTESKIIHGDQMRKVKELSSLEQNLFSDTPEIWPERTDAVRFFLALSPRSEVEWTASEILRLVREENYRFRDLAVAARGFDRYGPLVEEVFHRYGIPVFLDSMTDILQKPIFAVVTGALDTVAGDFAYEDVFRYLKTGLAGINRAECDKLEDYVLKWGIKGNRWTAKKDWDMHPRGYGMTMAPADAELLQQLNAIRRRVVEPLEPLRKNVSRTGDGQAKILYRYLEEIGLNERLVEHAERLRKGGEPKKAEEYRQLWDILCGGLDQCAELLGGTPMELDEFAKLFKLVLSQYDVGTIPVSLDRLPAGEAARLGNREIKALFLLGADDGAIPQAAPAPGLFTDDDRSLLASYGLELAPQLADKLDREMTIVYEACSRPTEKLTVSWAATGPQGEEQRPSFLQGKLRVLYPNNSVIKESNLSDHFRLAAPGPALELAGQVAAARAALSAIPRYASSVARIARAASSVRGRLSHEAVNSLYGRRVPMSASRMDKYKSCHFSYFMQYGLSAKPRQAALFQAPEYGTFVHYVLEHVLQEPDIQRDQVKSLVRGIMERYIAEELAGLENKTPRFIYLFQRLIRPVVQVVENVLDELRASEFKPIAFELGFGAKGDLPPVTFTADGLTVSISGFVDRVDGWVHGDKLYLRVVDYKTGRKAFDLTEIWNGIGLQMLLYLFTLQDKGRDVFGREVVPSGVLYLPAREAVIQGSRAMDDEERRKKADAELRRHGLVLDDAEVVEAMEAAGEGAIRFLPLKVSAKTGAITGDALVSAERLGKLKKHTERILREIGEELAAGNIAADPYWRGPEKNACRYCDYAAACHFEEGRGSDRKRWLPALDGEAFWNAVEDASE